MRDEREGPSFMGKTVFALAPLATPQISFWRFESRQTNMGMLAPQQPYGNLPWVVDRIWGN
jgi:hypothetical protein